MSRRCRRAVLGKVGVITWMVVVAAIAAIGPAAAQQAASPVDLRIAWWGSQDRHNRTIKTIELFQKKHPHIKVSYEFAGWSDYWTKMTTQAAGRNLPDVMQQDYAYIAEWSSRGLLAPLDDHVKNGTIDTRNVSEALLKGGVVGSKLVAINLGSNSQCWVVDLDAFKSAGLEPPAPTWTWNDFEKTALALREKLGIWGMGSGLWGEQLWGSLYLSAGQRRYSADGFRIGYSDDKPFVDYLGMLFIREGPWSRRPPTPLEDPRIVRRILAHLGRWPAPERPGPAPPHGPFLSGSGPPSIAVR